MSNIPSRMKVGAYRRYAKAAFAIVSFAVTLLLAIVFLYDPTDEGGFWKTLQDLGPVGDFMSGALTPWFTLASFLLLYAGFQAQRETIQQAKVSLDQNQEVLIQNKQLLDKQQEANDLYRQEVKMMIEEMEETRKEIRQQSETFAIQTFENTFFNMISLHQETASQLEIIYDNEEQRIKGRRYFRVANDHFLEKYLEWSLFIQDQYPIQPHEVPFCAVRVAYIEFFEVYQEDLGRYFRHLYRTVRFIDDAGQKGMLDEEQQDMYIGILRAQLSSYEFVLLLYNAMSDEGRKFKDLIDKHNLLDNMNKKLLFRPALYDVYMQLDVFLKNPNLPSVQEVLSLKNRMDQVKS